MKRILRSIINSIAILSTCTVLVLVCFTIPDLKSREMTLREAYDALHSRVQSLSAQNEALEQENMKLIAENEEVRAAIEANMDTLKESLEKQGFSIQEFSVSVNHNKSRNQDGYRENQKVLTKQEREDRGAITGNVTGRDVEMEILKTNPYQLNGSSINLIA